MNTKVNIISRPRVRILILLAGATLITLLMTSIAYAGMDPTNITIGGGSLNMSAAPVSDFVGVTLDGTAKTDTATITPFTVTDPRGTGAGWNVTVQATQFKEYLAAAYVPSGRTLALSSLSMAAPTVAAANGTNSAVPTMTSGPYVIDSGSAVKIASATANIGMGMGAYNFTGAGSLTLSIPASAYATTYRSEVTFTAATGP